MVVMGLELNQNEEESDQSPIIQTVQKKVASLETYENVNVNSFEEYCQRSSEVKIGAEDQK